MTKTLPSFSTLLKESPIATEQEHKQEQLK